IWTDVIQFVIVFMSATAAMVWLCFLINGGLPEFWHMASEAGKLRLIDLSTDPDVQFTLWVGLIAMPFQNVAAFGTDQLNAQRILCCRGPRYAAKAIIFSSFSQIVTILMLCIGAALFVYYQQHPPVGGERALFGESGDYVFPVWITTVLPPGLSGFVLAGAFA